MEYTLGDHFLVSVEVLSHKVWCCRAFSLCMPPWWHVAETWVAGFKAAEELLGCLSSMAGEVCGYAGRWGVQCTNWKLPRQQAAWAVDTLAWAAELVAALVCEG